ncbi:MAG: asparagine synthetase B family protein [Deltaproteobacteria bacterium]
MAGFVGLSNGVPGSAERLRSALGDGGATRLAERALLCVTGTRDVGLTQSDDGDGLACWGYVRRGDRRLEAGELLELWRKQGARLLESLGGEFAMAIRCDGELHVLRDRVGSRPVYVAELAQGVIAFATAISPLIRLGASAEPDLDAILRSLILGYVPAPQTSVRGVSQLRPGEIRRLRPRPKRWRLLPIRERLGPSKPLAQVARALDRTLDEAVRRALPSSGPIGAFLSGGLDSSLILAKVHAQRKVTAFTLHFGDRLPGEIRYARAVTRRLRVPHHVLELRPREFCDGIEPALTHLEDALYEPIAVPNFLLAQLASKSVDTLFTGEGGDPLFGGPKNIGLVLTQTYRKFPSAPSLAASYLAAHHHLDDDLEEAVTPEALAGFDRARLEHGYVAPALRRPAGTPGRGSFVGALMVANANLKGGNNILVKVSKMVGAHDLALRSPLFDPAVVDLAFQIPPGQKLWGTDEKVVLKAAVASALPRSVLERPKRGMAVPLSAWLEGELGTLAKDTLTERAVRARGLFRWGYVRRLLAGEQMPTELARGRWADKLWMLLITELQQRAVDRLAREARRG